MGQARSPFFVLVVEDDKNQRMLLSILLEASEMSVLECESAEAAMGLLDLHGPKIVLMITDVQLAGVMDGGLLARVANQRFPSMHVIVTSGRNPPEQLPKEATFMPKPWRGLDILREAERAHHAP
jgi:CheY-like chemotaxis protein